MTKPILTPEHVKSIFTYKSGVLYHRRRQETTPHDRMFNSRFAGKQCKTIGSEGYYFVGITVAGKYKQYRVHRIIFLMHHGYMPSQVDHKNHVKTDNNISNLRAATNQINGRNQSMPKTNTSGHVGVYWFKRDSKWESRITVNDKQLYLGRFTDKADAIKAREEANIKYGFFENHGKVVVNG